MCSIAFSYKYFLAFSYGIFQQQPSVVFINRQQTSHVYLLIYWLGLTKLIHFILVTLPLASHVAGYVLGTGLPMGKQAGDPETYPPKGDCTNSTNKAQSDQSTICHKTLGTVLPCPKF